MLLRNKNFKWKNSEVSVIKLKATAADLLQFRLKEGSQTSLGTGA